MADERGIGTKAVLDKVVYVGVDRLRPHPKNPRKHSYKQITQIAASIRAHGSTMPIVVDENFQILAGHGCLAAAQKIGMKKVPTIQVTHLNDEQKLTLLIADNKHCSSNLAHTARTLKQSF